MFKINDFAVSFLPSRWHQLFASGSSISNRERIVVFLFFAIFAAAFCNFQLVTALFHHLDAAFLMETLASIKKTGIPTTYLGPSFSDAFSTFTFNAETLCQADLIPSWRGLSVLDTHAYYILYPLAALTWLFPPHVILAVFNGLGFVSIIFILYWAIRRQGVPILGAIAFCLLVIAHPAWAHASLGDFYADRFFIPLGLLYVSLLYEAIIRQSNIGQNYLLLTLGIGLLAASTTERGAIMIALFTVVSLVLYRKRIAGRRTKIILTVFSIALLAYVFLYVKLLYVHNPVVPSLSSHLQQGIPLFFEQIQAPAYAAKVEEFIVINVLLFGIFALFDWRLALIALAALLPNLLTTIGGAEKTGWATHYHSMYFPFLVFASAIGFSKLWGSLGATKYRLILIGLLLALMPAISSYSTGYGGQAGSVKRLYDFYVKGSQSYEKFMYSQAQQIVAAVPAGAKVTTPEWGMPILYLSRTIYYYPVGIDSADYAVLTRVSQPDGSFYYAGAVSYIGESQKIDICLTERLRKAGFNVDQPKLLLGNTVVLQRSIK
jgi:hypothetical protein